MIGTEAFGKRLARTILIDRAEHDDRSMIGSIARSRSEENYRFASQFVSGKMVLDVGGGTGLGHDILLQSGAAAIRSIDKYVIATAPGLDPRISLTHADFLDCPVGDEAFDVVICLGTIFYLREADAALQKMHRILKPGGMLIMNCINQALVRQYFGVNLEEIDEKFSRAHDETDFRVFLKKYFDIAPTCFVQQPVPVPDTFLNSIRFWLTPMTWPLRRHPVVPKPPGTEGMYVYAVAYKNWPRTCDAR